MTDDMPIRLRRFTRDSDDQAFASHLRLKYIVFVAEQAWPLRVDKRAHRAFEDAADSVSCFVQAFAGERVAGTVRGTMLDQAFPHETLLSHHLERGGLALSRGQLATLNSVAVSSDLRGRQFPIEGFPQPLTIAKAMVCELVDWCRDQGAAAVIFTAIRGVSSVFFEHLGAYVLDPPLKLGSLACELVNMALVTVDPERFEEQLSPMRFRCPPRAPSEYEQACIAYGRSRHREVLAGKTIEQFSFPESPPPAEPG
jgi:GNAT superfamily N-acetyltransferase